VPYAAPMYSDTQPIVFAHTGMQSKLPIVLQKHMQREVIARPPAENLNAIFGTTHLCK